MAASVTADGGSVAYSAYTRKVNAAAGKDPSVLVAEKFMQCLLSLANGTGATRGGAAKTDASATAATAVGGSGDGGAAAAFGEAAHSKADATSAPDDGSTTRGAMALAAAVGSRPPTAAAGSSGGGPSAESQLYDLLDAQVSFSSPMALLKGRPQMRHWVAFDARVLSRVHHLVEYDPESGTVAEGGEAARTAVTTWRIAALTFRDTVTLNVGLLVRYFTRVMVREVPRSEEERKLTDALLLAWTGPFFASYVAPKKLSTSRIDNHVVVLPVLDFSFCDMTKASDMLRKRPRDGKEIRDTRIVFHFLDDAELSLIEAQRKPATAGASTGAAHQFASARGAPAHGRRAAGGGNGAASGEITIRARNRDGEQAALIIDRDELAGTKRGESRVEALEDAEMMGADFDRSRYAASGLKLNNNSLRDVSNLDNVLRFSVVNAFYFLTWLDLSSNAITHIPSLTSFPIATLYLHDNKIAQLEDVRALKDVRTLQHLTLYGNPVQSADPRQYKLAVLAALVPPDPVARPEPGASAAAGRRSATPGAQIVAGRRAASTAAAPPQQAPSVRLRLKSLDHAMLSVDDRRGLDTFYTRYVEGAARRPASVTPVK